MEIKEILSRVDHTLLSQSATWDEIKALCDDGIKYKTASVCRCCFILCLISSAMVICSYPLSCWKRSLQLACSVPHTESFF